MVEKLKMKPGRELDLLVAEKVMGRPTNDAYWDVDLDMMPHYSTDISAAWDIVEQMNEEDFEVKVCSAPDMVRITVSDWSIDQERFTIIEETELTSYAICRAALKAKGVEI